MHFLSGVPFGVRGILWNCPASLTDSEMKASQAEKRHERWEEESSHIWNRCWKRKRKKKKEECGQNIDGRACVCLMSAEDSSHSTSLTQIQTSQEADGALQKELKEGKKGKWGTTGPKVGHVSGVKGQKSRGHDRKAREDSQSEISDIFRRRRFRNEFAFLTSCCD